MVFAKHLFHEREETKVKSATELDGSRIRVHAAICRDPLCGIDGSGYGIIFLINA